MDDFERLAAALKPFADFATEMEDERGQLPDATPIYGFTAGHFRAARAAVEALSRDRDAGEQKVVADWSNLPADLYVTSVRRVDSVIWEVTLCNVPMALGPEVRYSLASPVSPVSPDDIRRQALEEAVLRKIELWFFRDMRDEQRLALFSVFGMPVHELNSQGHQKKVLRQVLCSLATSSPRASDAADTVAPATLARDAETKAGRVWMLDKCCSAISPCPHQQRDPYSVCASCAAALRASIEEPKP